MSFTGFQDKNLLSKIKSYLDTASAKEVILSTGFFRDFKCVINCGACCSAVALDFLESSQRWESFKSLYPEHLDKFEKKEIENGQFVFSYKNSDHGGKKCFFLNEEGRCNIHQSAPLPCRFAPVKFIDKRVSSNRSFLNANAYGRAWAFTQVDGKTKGALCEVIESFNYEKYLNDLSMLKELYEYSVKLQIPTKLPYIILYLESIDEDLKQNKVPKVNIIFDKENTY